MPRPFCEFLKRSGNAMPFLVHRTEDGLTVELEGAVTIGHAQDLATKIAEALDGDMSVKVGTAGLHDIDTSILQLLCSLQKTVSALSFGEPSEEFIGAVDRCGLRRELLGGIREGI
jgi:ABC-type transporter Mla MlaB component